MQRLLYLIIYPIIWLISIFPMWFLYFLSDTLYILVYHIVGYRKKVVYGNLALVFPEKSIEDRRKIAKKFFHHFCDIIFETLKSLSISEAEISKRFKCENPEILDDLYQKNRNVLGMCGHYASWEWSTILSKSMRYKPYAVYKKLDNPYFDRLVKNIRGRFGVNTVTNKKVVSILYREVKRSVKTLTLIISDQSPKAGAYKHRGLFMGIDVPVFAGTEELAQRLDFSVVYLQVKKVKRGYYTSRFVLLEENPTENPEFKITRMFLDAMENQIKEAPEFYLWSHKRWKLRN